MSSQRGQATIEYTALVALLAGLLAVAVAMAGGVVDAPGIARRVACTIGGCDARSSSPARGAGGREFADVAARNGSVVRDYPLYYGKLDRCIYVAIDHQCRNKADIVKGAKNCAKAVAGGLSVDAVAHAIARREGTSIIMSITKKTAVGLSLTCFVGAMMTSP